MAPGMRADEGHKPLILTQVERRNGRAFLVEAAAGAAVDSVNLTTKSRET